MSATNNGGPAFPGEAWNSEGLPQHETGMTLRDYFAAKAMQGLLAAGRDPQFGGNDLNDYARSAYWLADAMLEARGA